MIAETLYNILDELSAFHRSREELDALHIQERLDQSLQSYIGELKDSSTSIQGVIRNEVRPKE